MAVNMTTQSIAVGDNWVKVGDSYVGDNPSGATDGDTSGGTDGDTSGGTAALGWSAPDGLADGNTITITTDGTYDFGTGPSNVRFEDFSGGTLGEMVTSVNTVFDSSNTFYQGPFVADARSKGIAFSAVDPETSRAAQCTVDFTSTREVFVSFATKIPAGKYFPGAGGGSNPSSFYPTASAWKTAWLRDAAQSSPDGNDLVIPTMGNSAGGWSHSGNGLSTKLSLGNQPDWFGFNNWTRMTSYIKAGDVPQTDNGVAYFQGLTAGIPMREFSGSPVIFAGTNVAAPYHWTHLNAPAWNAYGTGGSDGNGADVEYLYDDVYVAWGAGAAARVEIGDNAVYESCSDKLAMQYVQPANWSSSQIVMTIKEGGFDLASASDLWLHITAADNTTRYSIKVK